MIGYFPSPYPDEPIYSLLSRYYVKSGYTNYICVAKELFSQYHTRPDVEFVNKFTPEAMSIITNNLSIKKLVLNHTMFPYYGRFLPKAKKAKAFSLLCEGSVKYKNYLAIPTSCNGKNNFLRYCPLCVQNDRQIYGETYWHRVHQMIGLNICPIHKCQLINSNMGLSAKVTPQFYDAESHISQDILPQYNQNKLEDDFAEYMTEVFNEDFDLETDVLIGSYLHSRIINTKYTSRRGCTRRMTVLHSDFLNYYKSLQENWCTELWQLQKIFTNQRMGFYEVCLLSKFLKISPNELTHPTPLNISASEKFDKQIFQLRKQGLKYPQIAKQLNASYNTVKPIGEGLWGKYSKSITRKSLKSGRKAQDWGSIDDDTLPLVKQLIKQLQEDDKARPRRLSISLVETVLGLPQKRIYKLPQCKSLILANMERQEEYWARETVWATNKIMTEDQPLNWKHLRNLTNMRPSNLQACIPYLKQYGKPDVIDKIVSISKNINSN